MNLGGIGWNDVEWICLALNRNTCRALVNEVTNFRFHKMLEVYGVAIQLVAPRVALSSRELVS
jgi:hypothetical protein